MVNWPNFISQCFNGLVLGALLALISSGLTIIYGTLGVLNLAHGAMFMLGGYAGWLAYTYTGSFIVAVIAGSLFLMVVGVLMERLIIRHFYDRPGEDQILVTFGLGIVIVETVRFFFGSLSKTVPAPPPFVGITSIGFMFYPTYRLALLGIVAVALLALYFVLYRTRIGMIVRAGIDDALMVDSLGINVYKVFMLVFGSAPSRPALPASSTRRWCRSRPIWAGDPRADLRRRRHRRRRFVLRRDPRRHHRRPDHQHHLNVQPRLFLRHVVRGDDAGAGAAPVRPARHGRPRMNAVV